MPWVSLKYLHEFHHCSNSVQILSFCCSNLFASIVEEVEKLANYPNKKLVLNKDGEGGSVYVICFECCYLAP